VVYIKIPDDWEAWVGGSWFEGSLSKVIVTLFLIMAPCS
jgi:hypothetical protein